MFLKIKHWHEVEWPSSIVVLYVKDYNTPRDEPIRTYVYSDKRPTMACLKALPPPAVVKPFDVKKTKGYRPRVGEFVVETTTREHVLHETGVFAPEKDKLYTTMREVDGKEVETPIIWRQLFTRSWKKNPWLVGPCPYCWEMHEHGLDVGHRSAHCKESRFGVVGKRWKGPMTGSNFTRRYGDEVKIDGKGYISRNLGYVIKQHI